MSDTDPSSSSTVTKAIAPTRSVIVDVPEAEDLHHKLYALSNCFFLIGPDLIEANLLSEDDLATLSKVMSDALWDSRGITGRIVVSIRDFHRLIASLPEMADDLAENEVHHITKRTEIIMKDLDLHIEALMTFSKDIHELSERIRGQMFSKKIAQQDAGDVLDYTDRTSPVASVTETSERTGVLGWTLSKFWDFLKYLGVSRDVERSPSTTPTESQPEPDTQDIDNLPLRIEGISKDIVDYAEGLRRIHVVHDTLFAEKSKKILEATPEDRSRVIREVIPTDAGLLTEADSAMRLFSRYPPTM